jgi:hypothetical protein
MSPHLRQHFFVSLQQKNFRISSCLSNITCFSQKEASSALEIVNRSSKPMEFFRVVKIEIRNYNIFTYTQHETNTTSKSG